MLRRYTPAAHSAATCATLPQASERIVRIVFATTGGPLATESLAALSLDHEIVAIVRPRWSWREWLAAWRHHGAGALGDDALDQWSRERRIPVTRVSSRRDRNLLRTLKQARPDVLCIALFPWILPPEVLAIPPAGVVNLHPSLLPRHRGPNPLFWVYYHNDSTTGMTVHVADERADSGPILVQHALDLPRGFPVEQLYLRISRESGPVYRAALKALANDVTKPAPQNSSAATSAPRVARRAPMVDFERWDVERVWHFLAGTYPRFREPLVDERGRPATYRAVPGFERGTTGGRPGSVVTVKGGWDLWCIDGRVRLSRDP